jgi:hypothetical protein
VLVAGTRRRMPDDSELGHLRKRLNQLINADLRYSYGR